LGKKEKVTPNIRKSLTVIDFFREPSRSRAFRRLMGMKRNRGPVWTWMAALVLVHLVITILHGSAHAKANVPLSPAANIFVLAVIVAGPLIGLGLTWPAQRIGTWLIALTMAG